MEFDKKFRTYSNVDLLRIIENPDDYQPQAVETAKTIISDRQLSEMEIKIAKDELEIEWQKKLRKEQQKRKIEDKVESIEKSVFDPINSILKKILMSKIMIITVSILFGGFFLFQVYKEFGSLFFFLSIPFWVGLIFLLRSLICKKNIGCGVFGLLAMILSGFLSWYLVFGINYQSKSDFIAYFELYTNLTYPQSGKIIEKKYKEFLNYKGDNHCAAIIEMDTTDYNKLLHNIQSRVESAQNIDESSYLLEKRFSANDCAYYYVWDGGEKSLWFHKNGKIIVFQSIDY